MPGTKRPHLDEEGVAVAIARVEEQLEQLRRRQAEATAPTEPQNVAAQTAPASQHTPAAAPLAQPTPTPQTTQPAAPLAQPTPTPQTTQPAAALVQLTPQQTPTFQTPQPSQHQPPAVFTTPVTNSRPLPFQAREYRPSTRRPRGGGEDTRGRMYYLYVCSAHRTTYCQTCGQYMSADEWRRSEEERRRLDQY